ncbi:lanthionine synthetase C family protein [Stackebrandtia soli]|uniref:lanthionine synthetase C family protein n=1 Tax=Stackebrandtia soli TaxID=1892856 RepID=UPI0039EBC478
MTPTPLRDEALRVSLDIADRLADPRHVRDHTDPAIWRDLSLSAGYAGIALLHAELTAHQPQWAPVLHRHLTAAGAAANDTADGAYTGRGALTTALTAARRATNAYTTATATAATAVARRAATRAAQPPPNDLEFTDYDLVTGLAGLVTVLTPHPDHHNTATDTTDALATLCLRDTPDPGWWVHHGPNPHTTPPPGGHGNLGLSHGAAGILAALTRAAEAGITNTRTEAAADLLATWLLDHHRTDEHGTWWPMYVTDSDTTAERPAPSWCYGTPGIATALDGAGRWRRRPDWVDTATKAVDAALRAPTGPLDNGICHGHAGLAHVLWRLDPERHADTIDAAITTIVDAYDPDTAFGYRCHGDTGPFDHPGFLEGAAGTALVLHRYATGPAPRTHWDQILLL